MMKSLRFILAIASILLALMLIINLPVLGKGVLRTIVAIPAKDWAKYIAGAIIGAVSMWFANKKGSKE